MSQKKRENNLTDEAKQDVQDSAEYYKDIDPELAQDFLAKNEALMARIEDAPEQFPKVYKTVRRALMKRFPYMVMFIMKPVENIVIGVFHQSSNPDKWKNRADENLK